MSAEEGRDFGRFAMSAEEESYATQRNLSPAKMSGSEKERRALDLQRAPAGMIFAK